MFIHSWILEQEIFTEVIPAAEHFASKLLCKTASSALLLKLTSNVLQEQQDKRQEDMNEPLSWKKLLCPKLWAKVLFLFVFCGCGYDFVVTNPLLGLSPSWFDHQLGKDAAPPLLVEGDVELICFPGWRRPFRKQAARFHHWFSYDERNHSGGRRLSVLSSCGNGITALRYFRDPFLRLCILVGWGGGHPITGSWRRFSSTCHFSFSSRLTWIPVVAFSWRPVEIASAILFYYLLLAFGSVF